MTVQPAVVDSTSKVMVAVPLPAPSMSPKSTLTLLSPTVLPEVTEPVVVVTEPITSEVLAGAESVNTTLPAVWLPLLVMVTV